jgi:hypothetical protein
MQLAWVHQIRAHNSSFERDAETSKLNFLIPSRSIGTDRRKCPTSAVTVS